MDAGVSSALTGASRRTKLGRKLSRRLSLVAKFPNMISVRLKQELGGSRDSLRNGRNSHHRHLEITAIAPDKTQRIVSTLPVVSYERRTRSHTVRHGYPTRGSRAAFDPPGCIMRPAATFVNCVRTIKIYNNLDG